MAFFCVDQLCVRTDSYFSSQTVMKKQPDALETINQCAVVPVAPVCVETFCFDRSHMAKQAILGNPQLSKLLLRLIGKVCIFKETVGSESYCWSRKTQTFEITTVCHRGTFLLTLLFAKRSFIASFRQVNMARHWL